MRKSNEEKPINLFKEGSLKNKLKESIKYRLPAVKENNISEDVKDEITNRVNENTSQWDILKNMIEGDLTERFISELQAMPGKDFVRNYLKLIEHFKPKLTRAEEGSTDKFDTTINIQTVIINKLGEKEIVDITELQGNESFIGLDEEE